MYHTCFLVQRCFVHGRQALSQLIYISGLTFPVSEYCFHCLRKAFVHAPPKCSHARPAHRSNRQALTASTCSVQPPTSHTPKPPTSAFCLLDNLLVPGLQDTPGACGFAGSSLHRVWVEARGTQVLRGLTILEKLEGAAFDLYSLQRARDLWPGLKHW